ncbi:probable inactive purple acid phosphatase 27 [Coccomyxa sp. Obi]|nr:probable inactive purple acid phosphatase 27 [Coccomyxa sp. Obi]
MCRHYRKQAKAEIVVLVCAALLHSAVGRPQPDVDLTSRKDCQPEQVHLALTGDPTEMRVSWKTDGSGCGGRLHWAKDGDNLLMSPPSLNQSLPSEESSYSADDMCSEPAISYDFDPPHLHSAVMTGLVPGERYQYSIGQHLPVRSFRAAAKPAPDAGFTFIVYGDMGESDHKAAKSPGAEDTAENVKQEVFDRGADMVLHMGDISYANGEVRIWDAFMRYIEPYASAAPYMIGVGNHEYDYRTGGEKHHKHPRHPDASGSDEPYDPDWGNYGNDSGGECGVAVAKRFLMPNSATASGPSSNAPFWYGFDYGSVHFAIISTEHDLRKGSPQREWLEAELEGVDRCVTPWLLVGMHRPMYVPYPHKSNRVVGRHLQDILEDLFLKHEVDMVMSGHVHLYARTCSVKHDRCKKAGRGGITHVTVGCGGHKLSAIEDDQKAWIASAASHYGYGRVTVDDSGSLLWEYVRTKDGRTHDSVLLHNHQSDRCNAAQNASADGGASMAADVSGDDDKDGVVGAELADEDLSGEDSEEQEGARYFEGPDDGEMVEDVEGSECRDAEDGLEDVEDASGVSPALSSALDPSQISVVAS